MDHHDRERGPKRKRLDESVFEKARKYIPLNADTNVEKVNVCPKELEANLKLDLPPRVKKPRKTIRGADGVKIRPVVIPPPPPPPTKEEKRKLKRSRSRGNKDSKTESTPGSPATPVTAAKKGQEELTATPSTPETPAKKKNKKKKKKNKKKTPNPGEKLPETDKRHSNEAVDFLKKWKYERSEWKFEKLKQVWLLKNILNEIELDEESFEILLEYVSSVQGRARAQTLKEMQESMSGIEKKANSETMKVQYERSRRIVQMLTDD